MGKDLQDGRPGHRSCDRAWSGALARSASAAPLPTIGTDSLAEDHPVVFANDAFLAMTGAARCAVLGQPLARALGGRAEAETLSQLRAALAEGRGGSWRMRLARADGAAFPAVVYAAAIRDADDRVAGHGIAIVDLTSIGQLPREGSAPGPGIYDKAPGFIAISRGPEHRIEYTNASYRAFVMREDLVGRTVAEALPEIADQGFLAVLDEVYRTGRAFRASDLPISLRDPATGRLQERWMDVLYQPVRDQSGAIVGLFCEGQDVTDRHELNAALAALEMTVIHTSRVNAMGTMAATLAHELNQPLTAITNYLAGAQVTNGGTPEVDRLVAALDGIEEATRRAAAILAHLRQLTRHRKPVQEPFNLREAAAECVRLVDTSSRHKVAFDNRIPGDTIMVADRVKIQQVLINLLQNACEAMAGSDKARAIVDARPDERGITVSVADTGPGVSPEALATMFAWSESTKEDGMGIGLSICRTIVELYGGRIWLERTGPEGSEFRFRLPSLPAGDRPGSAP